MGPPKQLHVDSSKSYERELTQLEEKQIESTKMEKVFRIEPASIETVSPPQSPTRLKPIPAP